MELNMKTNEHSVGQKHVLAMSYNVLLEELILELGGCGLFQILLSCTVHLVHVPAAFSMFTMAFAGQNAGFKCLDDAGDVISNSTMKDVCDMNATKHCHDLIFDKSMNTVVSEWSLVCDRAWMVAMITTVQSIGLLIGALIAGHAADHFGRKPMFFSGVLIMVIFNFVAYFSVSWVMFAMIRCFIGIGMAIYFIVRDNMQIEVTSPKWRPVVMSVPSWTICSSLFGLFAWIFKDWKNMQLAIGCLGIPILLTWWFVPESFRWMVTKERFKDAEKTVGRIAKLNRKPVPELDHIFKVAKDENEKKKTERKYSVIDMFRTRENVKHTLILTFAWFSCSLAYYGFSFGVKSLSGNLYMNIFLMNIVEVPCIFSVAYFVNLFGRKKVCLVLFLLSGSTGVSVGVMQFIDYPLDGDFMNALSITSKVACTCAWVTVMILSAEYYPTVIRAVATGTLGFGATVGAIVAPQIVFLNDSTPGLLYLSGGALMMVSLALVLLCKETKGMPLNDTLEERTVNVDDITDKGLDNVVYIDQD